jgi:hypothetical protein
LAYKASLKSWPGFQSREKNKAPSGPQALPLALAVAQSGSSPRTGSATCSCPQKWRERFFGSMRKKWYWQLMQ